MVFYLGLCHLLALFALFYYILFPFVGLTTNSISYYTLLFSFLLWPVSGLGITAGAHRLWSHKSYQASTPLKVFLMVCNSIANQGSIFHWCRDHRAHHRFADTEFDIHDSNRGKFYAHCGWLLLKKTEEVKKSVASGSVDLSDLSRDRVVMFQRNIDRRSYGLFNMGWCFLFPTLVCCYGWGESWVAGLLVAGFLRYVWVLHCTWAVNSLVHDPEESSESLESSNGNSESDLTKKILSSHVYSKQILSLSSETSESSSKDSKDLKKNLIKFTVDPPKESALVAFLAIGEGWHSYHHAYAFDYATSEMSALEQYNPTKVFIDCCCFLGLAWGRKRGLRLWEREKERRRGAVEDSLKGKSVVRIKEGVSGLPMFRVRTIEYEIEDHDDESSSSKDELVDTVGDARPPESDNNLLNKPAVTVLSDSDASPVSTRSSTRAASSDCERGS